MNFDWEAEQSEIKEKVAGLFEEIPIRELDVTSDVQGLKKMMMGFLGKLAEIGYLGLGVGPEGQKDLVSLIAAQEALAGVSGSLFLAVETTARLFGGLVEGWGAEALKGEVTGPLQKGSLLTALAFADPPGGDEAKTVARQDGDVFVVSGKKDFVTNGPIADLIAVAGTVDDKPAFWVVTPDQNGVTIGPRIQTVGYDGLAVSSLTLKDVKVQKNRVIGPFEDDKALRFLSMAQDLMLAVVSLGAMSRMIKAANSHIQSHSRGGKPSVAHQDVRFKISEMFTLHQTAQLLAYRAGWFCATNDGEKETLVNCAKVFCAEASEDVAGRAMQAMAGQGYISGNPVEKGFREAKYAAVAGTTSEVSRMNIAGAQLKRYPA